MDGKAKGWCVLRCAGGVQSMFRFRPIAPKPVSSGTASGNLSVDNKNLLLTSKRSKRKYVRVRKNNGYKPKKNNIETDNHEDGLNKNVVTLQLLPEKPTTKEESLSWCNNNTDLDLRMSSKVDDNRLQDLTAAIWLNFKGKDMINCVEGGGFGLSDQTVAVSRRKVVVVESWVTVESVTDTCMDTTKGLGCTDVERMKINLENGTCPGFISDAFNRVWWVNEAYKKMVMGSKENGYSNWVTLPEMEIIVWLVIKEELPSLDCSMFTTKVRLQNTWQKEKYSKMVPCDVFRLDGGGGFSWRLDVEAALSLGR